MFEGLQQGQDLMEELEPDRSRCHGRSCRSLNDEHVEVEYGESSGRLRSGAGAVDGRTALG